MPYDFDIKKTAPISISNKLKERIEVVTTSSNLYKSSFFETTIPPFNYADRISRLIVLGYLDAFSSLKENWDGHEAIVPYIESINNCKRFIGLLPNSIVEKIERDNVYPTPYGTVVLDLKNKKSEKVSLEFGKTKFGFFSELNDSSNPIIEEEIFYENSIPNKLENAITMVYQNSFL